MEQEQDDPAKTRAKTIEWHLFQDWLLDHPKPKGDVVDVWNQGDLDKYKRILDKVASSIFSGFSL